jgi:hypothetical protein
MGGVYRFVGLSEHCATAPLFALREGLGVREGAQVDSQAALTQPSPGGRGLSERVRLGMKQCPTFATRARNESDGGPRFRTAVR